MIHVSVLDPPKSNSAKEKMREMVRQVVADKLGLPPATLDDKAPIGSMIAYIALILAVEFDKSIIATPDTTITDLVEILG